ncbi:hypothetical protein [Rubrivirga sp.]|uniref:hypothetical protein n=1 Tax=Rubrivirga sp. TaxID=1885344 RepID=UPI003C729617
MAYRPDLEETLARYADVWNTTDGDQRWGLAHSCLSPDAIYTDPHEVKPVRGQAAMTAFAALFQEQVGWTFEWAGTPDAHHEWVRVPWRLAEGGETRATGLFVASIDSENRLHRIIHFVDGE